LIVVPNAALPYLLLQRTDYLVLPQSEFLFKVACRLSKRTPLMTAVSLESRLRKRQVARRFDADMHGEYADIRGWLPESATAILDVGCGLGGIDVLLFDHYRRDPDLRFFLLDRTQIDDQIGYGYRDRADFYNSFEMTRAVVTGNGVPASSVATLEARDDAGIDLSQQVDLVISLISWGFHYPVATYLDRTYELLRPGGRLILDVRKDTGGLGEIEAKYGSATVISSESKRQRVVATR
jgi:SAM-dependent methyltransferase